MKYLFGGEGEGPYKNKTMTVDAKSVEFAVKKFILSVEYPERFVELEEEWCCEIFSGRRCRLERLHRLMVTDTWKGWTDKKYNEGVTRSIKDRLLGFK